MYLTPKKTKKKCLLINTIKKKIFINEIFIKHIQRKKKIDFNRCTLHQ